MRASFWRLWLPAVSMLAVSLISYIDRNTLALLAPTILAETHLTAEQYGYVISTFSIAYMLSNPLWGRWLDRFGVRNGMLVAVSFWSLASAAHALVSSFAGFAMARGALGFGEGATFPGGLRTVVQTLPERLRARGVAIAYSGGSLGAVLTPLIVTPIFVAFGWRAAFLLTGLAGALWLAGWLLLSRRAELRTGRAEAHHTVSIPWRDARLWSFMVAYALGCLPIAFVLYQVPLYLARGLGQSQTAIGAVLWIPPLGWECGYFVWGWIADRLCQGRSDALPQYRRITLAALALTLPLAFGPRLGFGGLLALLFWTMFVAGGYLIVTVHYATYIFTTAQAGLIAGLGAGAWSAFVAVAMPWFGRLADARLWAQSFLAATAIPLAGFTFWLWVNRPRRRPC